MAGFSILKKGDAKDKKPDEKAAPDELPPLGEEAIKKDDKAADAKPAEIPDELPPIIDAPEPKIEQSAPQAVQKEEDILLDLPMEQAMQQDAQPQQSPAPAQEASSGFFANLFSVIKKPGLSHRLDKEDLVARMKENWEVKDTAVRKGISVSDENELQRKLETTLNDLRVAESRWRTQKMALEENQRLMKEKEDEIRKKSEEFKKLLKKTQLMSSVPKDKVLILRNTITVRSVTELIAALKKMDNKTFMYHCSQSRNDFYDFVRHVSHDVADRIKGTKLRPAMIGVLEDAVKEVMKE